MSTKNIARTAVEPGRVGWFKGEVKQYKRVERFKTHEQERTVTIDPESWEETFLHARRIPRLEQGDKLGPLKRWLRSHCGQPWNAVYSEMRERFDFRSITGSHIVGHLLDYVDYEKTPIQSQGSRFFVDNNGILRARALSTKVRGPRYAKRKQVFAWLAGRKVRIEADELWWFGERKIESKWRRCHHDQITYVTGRNKHTDCPYEQRFAPWRLHAIESNGTECFQPVAKHFNRLRRLTKKERTFWNSIEPEFRKKFITHPYNV